MSNFESGPALLRDDGKPLRYEEAAKQVEVWGWACVKCGQFYGKGDGAEHSARYCCHTDAPCECGGRKGRHRTTCESCWHKEKCKRYGAMEQKEWDERSPLAIYDGDTYFFDFDAMLEWCLEHGIKPSDAFVVHCREQHPPRFELSCFMADCLPDDQEFDYDEAARELENKVNELLEARRPWSWYPDNKARPTDAEMEKWDAEYDADAQRDAKRKGKA